LYFVLDIGLRVQTHEYVFLFTIKNLSLNDKLRTLVLSEIQQVNNYGVYAMYISKTSNLISLKINN